MKKIIIIVAILAALYLVLEDNDTPRPQTTLHNPNTNQGEFKPVRPQQ